MAEYVSKETLLKAVEKINRLDKETNTKYEYDKEGYILLIQNAPKADVVEVVRCKDCAVPHNEWTGCPYLNGLIPSADFYCACGEKRGDL